MRPYNLYLSIIYKTVDMYLLYNIYHCYLIYAPPYIKYTLYVIHPYLHCGGKYLELDPTIHTNITLFKISTLRICF